MSATSSPASVTRAIGCTESSRAVEPPQACERRKSRAEEGRRTERDTPFRFVPSDERLGFERDARADRPKTSVVVREGRPVRRALLEEGIAALDGLVGHVREPGRLAGKDLLADPPVVDRVERKLEHP